MSLIANDMTLVDSVITKPILCPISTCGSIKLESLNTTIIITDSYTLTITMGVIHVVQLKFKPEVNNEKIDEVCIPPPGPVIE
jgi:hypothetical protein